MVRSGHQGPPLSLNCEALGPSPQPQLRGDPAAVILSSGASESGTGSLDQAHAPVGSRLVAPSRGWGAHRGPGVPWQPLACLRPRFRGSAWSSAMRTARAARRHRPLHCQGPSLLPCVFSHSSPRKDAFLQKDFCTLRVRLPCTAAPSPPGAPSLEACGSSGPVLGPGGSSSRKLGPHPGTKPRSMRWPRALGSRMAASRSEGPGPRAPGAGTWSDNQEPNSHWL